MILQAFFDELTEQNPTNIHSLVKHVAKDFIHGEYPDEVRKAVQVFVDENELLFRYECRTAGAWNCIRDYLKAQEAKEAQAQEQYDLGYGDITGPVCL